MESESRAGYAVAVMFILAVVGAAWAFGNFDAASQAAAESAAAVASASPAPTPAELPEEVAVGASVAEASGQVEETQFHFESGDDIAFSAWLGVPAGVEEVDVTLLRLDPSGFTQAGDPQPFTINPDALVISGTLPASVVSDGAGPGTYLIDVQFPGGDRIGYGAFQVGATQPESIEYFVDGPRQALVTAGAHTGVQFDAEGNVTQQSEATLANDSSAPTTFRAVFGGEPYLFISDGIWGGYFLPESESVSLAP